MANRKDKKLLEEAHLLLWTWGVSVLEAVGGGLVRWAVQCRQFELMRM